MATRSATERCRIHVRLLDLDEIERSDRWIIGVRHWQTISFGVVAPLLTAPGTVVVWERLDRALDVKNPGGGWARRRMDRLINDLTAHLGMVFHRFLAGEAQGREQLKISVNGSVVQPWDPFARDERGTIALPAREMTIDLGDEVAIVGYRPFVLPHRSAFSSAAAFERLSGPAKWNRQQGFYVYRSDRLIQSGGWNGLRAIDEHTKFARAALEFSPALDNMFAVNVPKMRIRLPSAIRVALEREIGVLSREAQNRYRRGEIAGRQVQSDRAFPSSDLRSAGVALYAAAMEVGEIDALHRIVHRMKLRVPDVVRVLGVSEDLSLDSAI